MWLWMPQELRSAKADNSKLQAVVFEKHSVIQRKDVEVWLRHALCACAPVEC